MGMDELLKKAKEFLPEKLFREISEQQKINPIEAVQKGLKSGTAESGTHAHALMRNLLKTAADGRHRHIFVVRNTGGELIRLLTELDGEHWHTLDENISTMSGSDMSMHQHVLRIHWEIPLETGETLQPGMVFITERDGAHSHGTDMLETTNFDGAHKHVVQLPGGMSIESVDIQEFWDIFGPFDLSDISPIYSTEQIYDRYSHPCDLPIMKSYSGYMEMENDIPDWKRAIAASLGQKIEKSEQQEVVFKANEVQEVVLSKSKYKTRKEALLKLREMEYEDVTENSMEETEKVYRVEIKKPSEFRRETLRELSVEKGVKVISGVLKTQSVRKATEIQTLIFPKDKFDRSQATAFAKRNDFHSNKVDETGSSFRLRQRDPGDFVRLRTITLPGSNGVKAVVGPVKKEAEEQDFNRVAKSCPENIYICKQDDEKRIVTGIVLEPDVVDLQGDMITEDEIEKSAAFFIQKSRTIGYRHKSKAKAVLVGSMVMPAAFTINGPNGKQKVKKGTWLISVHVPDDKLWADVKAKRINAFSVGGFGAREPVGKENAEFGQLKWTSVS